MADLEWKAEWKADWIVVQLIIKYSHSHPRFDPGYVNSLEHQLEQGLVLTDRQRISVRKMLDTFRIREWMTKYDIRFDPPPNPPTPVDVSRYAFID
jgi:hypothetical protein